MENSTQETIRELRRDVIEKHGINEVSAEAATACGESSMLARAGNANSLSTNALADSSKESFTSFDDIDDPFPCEEVDEATYGESTWYGCSGSFPDVCRVSCQ